MSEVAESETYVDEEDKVEKWRYRELKRAGYTHLHALQISARHSGPDAIDLHEAISLVEKGADPHVAADILL